MPQIKSQMKRMRVSEKQRLRNRSIKSALKTFISNFDKAYGASEKEKCKDALAIAVKSLDTAVSKGVVHKNKAANQKSRLTLKFNAMPEKAPEPEEKPVAEKKTTRKTTAKKKPAARKAAAKKAQAKKPAAAAKKPAKPAAKTAAKTTKKAVTKKSTPKKEP